MCIEFEINKTFLRQNDTEQSFNIIEYNIFRLRQSLVECQPTIVKKNVFKILPSLKKTLIDNY